MASLTWLQGERHETTVVNYFWFCRVLLGPVHSRAVCILYTSCFRPLQVIKSFGFSMIWYWGSKKSCLITARRITFHGEELNQISASTRPDSQEPPRLRECSYSHNMSPQLTLQNATSYCSCPRHSNFPQAFMYEHIFRHNYKMHPSKHFGHRRVARHVPAVPYCVTVARACLVFPAATSLCHIGHDGKSLRVHSVPALFTKDTQHFKSVHKPAVLLRPVLGRRMHYLWHFLHHRVEKVCGRWASIFCPVGLRMAL